MRLRPRSLSAAAVTLSVALALGACGADDESSKASSGDTSASPSATATDGATDGPSDAATSDTEATSPSTKATAKQTYAAGSSVEPDAFAGMLGDALVEGRTAKIQMKVTGDDASTSSGVADFTAQPPALRLATAVDALAGQKSEAVMVDGVIYIQMGTGTDGKYAKMDLADIGDGSGLTQFDPKASFEKFARTFSEVSYVGEEKVGGEQLRHYRAVVDAKKAKKADSWRLSDYDAWFDADGRLRRIVLDLGNGTVSTMTYSDWGRKVDIKAPPAKQVVDMPTMPEAPVDR